MKCIFSFHIFINHQLCSLVMLVTFGVFLKFNRIEWQSYFFLFFFLTWTDRNTSVDSNCVITLVSLQFLAQKLLKIVGQNTINPRILEILFTNYKSFL